MMSDNFHIGKLGKSDLLIILNSYLRIDDYMPDLEESISEIHSEISEIYFDFLIKNGPNDRFYKALLSNGKIISNSFEKVIVSKKIEKRSNTYFSKNLYLLNNSLMSKAQKFVFKKKVLALA